MWPMPQGHIRSTNDPILDIYIYDASVLPSHVGGIWFGAHEHLPSRNTVPTLGSIVAPRQEEEEEEESLWIRES